MFSIPNFFHAGKGQPGNNERHHPSWSSSCRIAHHFNGPILSLPSPGSVPFSFTFFHLPLSSPGLPSLLVYHFWVSNKASMLKKHTKKASVFTLPWCAKVFRSVDGVCAWFTILLISQHKPLLEAAGLLFVSMTPPPFLVYPFLVSNIDILFDSAFFLFFLVFASFEFFRRLMVQSYFHRSQQKGSIDFMVFWVVYPFSFILTI